MKPIQMPNMDMDELFQARRAFTEGQWIDVLLRSTGMEPTNFAERVKWHLLARMVPLIENNFNLAELGPRGTGKSHIYKEISPNSILVRLRDMPDSFVLTFLAFLVASMAPERAAASSGVNAAIVVSTPWTARWRALSMLGGR